MRPPDDLALHQVIVLEPFPAHGYVAHLAVKHGQSHRRVLNEQLQQVPAFVQCFLGLPGLGNVLDDARHPNRAPLSVELQSSHAVYPAHRPVCLANDPIFPVKGLALPEYLILEIRKHRRSIVGMDQGSPSLDGVLELLIDPENLVHDIRTRPFSGTDIERVAAQSRDPLRLFKRFLALAERRVSALALGDVFGENDDPTDLAVTGQPGSNLSS